MNLLGQSIFLAPIQKRKSEENMWPTINSVSVGLSIWWVFKLALLASLDWFSLTIFEDATPQKQSPKKKLLI